MAAENSALSSWDESTACEESWIFFNGFCYFFSEPEDIIPPMDASKNCLLLDAEHVYLTSGEELSFLQSQTSLRTTYGWSINLRKDFFEDTYSIKQLHSVSSDSMKYVNPDPKTIPKFQKSYDRDNKCVALHVESNFDLSTEPCEVKLWAVCQGKLSDFQQQTIDYEKWFSHEDLVFWLSGKMGNQTEATDICKKENMEVITSITDLKETLSGTYDLTPWWVGLALGKGGLELEDGTSVNLSPLSWLPISDGYGMRYFALMHSGDARYIQIDKGMPYICKKRMTKQGLLGCPNLWIRAARSCYFLNKYSRVTWSEANGTCESRGSHLLSINSLDEKLWIEHVALRYLPTTWTSGNDLITEGKFTWHDGSEINNVLVPWQKAPFNEYWRLYEKKCVNLSPRKLSIFSISCDGKSSPVCQYELEKGETQCEDKWDELDGVCYLVDAKTPKMTYKRMTQYCRNISKSKQARPIMIKTKDTAQFISLLTLLDESQNFYMWLGMEVGDTMDSWRWVDGTKVDFSVFNRKNQPDNGNGKKPENCVAVNSMLNAYDNRCDRLDHFICEKDLPPVGVVSLDPGGAASLRVANVVLALSTFIALVGRITLDCL